MGGTCSAYGSKERCIQDFGGETRGERPLRRSMRRWEENIKMDLEEVGRRVTDWMELAEEWDSWRALVIAVMNLRVP